MNIAALPTSKNARNPKTRSGIASTQRRDSGEDGIFRITPKIFDFKPTNEEGDIS